MKMTQIWKNGSVFAVSPLKLAESSNVDSFKEGDLLKIVGKTKSKGFQGVVKRHGFGGGPKTHGQKNRYRAPGSIGSTAMQRVVPGRKMAGRMGGDRKTLKNIEVMLIIKEKATVLVKGSVPGNTGDKLMLNKL